MPRHPLEPLSTALAAEVAIAVQVLRDSGKVTETTRFVSVMLKEPLKGEVHSGEKLPRQAAAVLFDTMRRTRASSQN